MASDTIHLRRLHEELAETERPAGPMTMGEAVSLASRMVQSRSRAPVSGQPPGAVAPAHGQARRVSAPGAVIAAGASLAAAASWLLRRRRPASAVGVAPDTVVAARPRLRRGRGAGDAPTPPNPGRSGRRLAAPELHPVTATPPAEITQITRKFLMWVVLPVWQAAGLADWWCHRRARIEDNAGSKESLIHLMMLAEASVPVIAGMTLEITSPILLLMFGAVLLHSLTGLWDVSYAVKQRTVTPLEQHVHSYLEMVPVMATAFVTVLHWPELQALLGLGERGPDWSIRRKARPLPSWGVLALLAGMAAFELAPYVEELRRTRDPARRDTPGNGPG